MSKFIKDLLASSAAVAAALMLVLAFPLAAAAAEKDAASPEKGAAPEADKSKDEAKPDEAPPPDEKAAEEAPSAAGQIQSAVKMKDILAEGFLIRTTVFVPADAVTRQIGKVSSDAILLTLQKEAAIAVCYYTLEAGLTDIASCTVFR